MRTPKKGMSPGKKTIIGVIAVLILLSGAAYGAGVFYFSEHFLPGSMVNGFNCSYMTEGEAQQLIGERIKAYAMGVVTRGNGQEAVTAEQIGLMYTPDEGVSRLIREQDRFLWFLKFQQHQSYQLPEAVSFDPNMLRETVGGLRCMQEANMVQPTDAAIVETDEGYEIVPENLGNALDREKVIEVIGQAAVIGQTSVNLEEAGCYQKPAVYQDDETLIKHCQQMNQLTSAVITYDFADRTERVDRSLIKHWLTVDEKGDCVLDPEKVAAYVDELGYKYDTFGMTRTFLTYDSREIVVPGGDYGWAIDQEAETEALMKALQEGVTEVREPVYAYTAASRAVNDIGYTYVEIDLASQRLVLYQDGYPIVDTPVVTGNPNGGHGTPSGVYAIDAKQSPSVLRGEDYAAEVTFWMPFCGDVGLHDASWRNEFGGLIYTLEGSHGCVNIPYDQAEIIYNTVDIGTPVVVY